MSVNDNLKVTDSDELITSLNLNPPQEFDLIRQDSVVSLFFVTLNQHFLFSDGDSTF